MEGACGRQTSWRRPPAVRREAEVAGWRRLLEIGMLAVGEGGDCWVNRPLVVRNCRRRLDLGHGRRRLDGRREAVRLEGSGGRDCSGGQQPFARVSNPCCGGIIELERVFALEAAAARSASLSRDWCSNATRSQKQTGPSSQATAWKKLLAVIFILLRPA
jgi:hypothetical protein